MDSLAAKMDSVSNREQTAAGRSHTSADGTGNDMIWAREFGLILGRRERKSPAEQLQ
jgi:hypothetical protein